MDSVLYYYAYLAEEIAAPGGFTVAPGCGDDGGTRIIGTNTKRCTINEFLRYIWKATPSTGDTVRSVLLLLFLVKDSDGYFVLKFCLHTASYHPLSLVFSVALPSCTGSSELPLCAN